MPEHDYQAMTWAEMAEEWAQGVRGRVRAEVETLTRERDEARAEIVHLRHYIGDEEYRSDFQTAGHMRKALEETRAEVEKLKVQEADTEQRLCDEIMRNREVTRLTKAVERLQGLLYELHCLVVGECPALLNEDSGGDANLDTEIRQALATACAEKRMVALVDQHEADKKEHA